MSSTGYVREIFSSIQGEGLLVGRRQIFVRFSGCNLRCAYCDTPESQGRGGYCQVQEDPNHFSFRLVENPLSAEETATHIDSLNVSLHHSVSLTGGEPLTQQTFLSEIAGYLKKKGVRIFLETNGTLPDFLRTSLDVVDMIGMDWKLPCATGERDYTHEHVRTLKMGEKKTLFVKLVVTDPVDVTEFERACVRISEVGSEIPLVIQPVTPLRAVKPPPPEAVLQLHLIAKQYLRDVRVLPQMHTFMGLQ